jgi:hypothetical protein
MDIKPELDAVSKSVASEPIIVKTEEAITEEAIAEDFDRLMDGVDWADMDMDMDVDMDMNTDNKPMEVKAQPTIFATVDNNADCTDWTAVPIQPLAASVPNMMADTTAASLTQNSQGSQWSQDTSILESDGSLRMYWFDAYEKNGMVYIFGKVSVC